MTVVSAPAASDERPPSSVARVVDEIRAMLRSRELVPGQQVRQEAVAARLGVSRVPVREALKALEAEGVLRHAPNVGYAVARLNADELRQTYLMRRALETEVLLAVPRLGTTELRELTEINNSIVDEVDTGDVTGIVETNQAFHFTMFGFSGMDLVVAEIDRLWRMSEAYRTVHLYDAEKRRRVVREHKKMITALRRGDNAAVIALMDAHRDRTVADLRYTLGLPLEP